MEFKKRIEYLKHDMEILERDMEENKENTRKFHNYLEETLEEDSNE